MPNARISLSGPTAHGADGVFITLAVLAYLLANVLKCKDKETGKFIVFNSEAPFAGKGAYLYATANCRLYGFCFFGMNLLHEFVDIGRNLSVQF